MQEIEALSKAVIEGDIAKAEFAAKKAIESGLSSSRILKEALSLAMDVVGKRMKAGEYYIPEVMISSQAFKAASAIIGPGLTENDTSTSVGKIVLGTVYGDLHDIGKNLVALMLKGAGFEIIDLGINVPAERFLDTLQETKANILALSALITTTMVGMREVIDLLSKNNMRDKVKVMIGGAPVTKRFADEIGADGYSPDSAGSVELARRFLGQTVK